MPYLDCYITVAFMVAFFGGMVTMWVAIQLDKLLTVLFLSAHKYLGKDNNKSQNNKQDSDIVEHGSDV